MCDIFCNMALHSGASGRAAESDPEPTQLTARKSKREPIPMFKPKRVSEDGPVRQSPQEQSDGQKETGSSAKGSSVFQRLGSTVCSFGLHATIVPQLQIRSLSPFYCIDCLASMLPCLCVLLHEIFPYHLLICLMHGITFVL